MIVDEESPLRERFWHPHRGDVVLDIGCFHGAWTLPALNAGAHVHAFDANPEALDLLPSHPRLFVVPMAVSDGGPYREALYDRIPSPMRPSGPWTTIDEHVAKHGLYVDWIKIDIEGGELAALQGAQETLKRDRPWLIIEEHSLVYPDVLRGNLTDVLQLLWEADYETQVIPLRGERWPIHIIADPA